ncbi:TPA: type 2 lantipeptide synthetase LanM family protein [Streptococcus pyogenes]|nr:type 2 lantipeptide synthetase LanM family protein [Streptococcus pyogenes]HEP7078271.1 type 2 lantipeptide synthetase LanM family protein [Streptococcus pyogenes]HEQ1341851.1 type 2 lantipeptide synthetase LanM family protein [Streptococcus pyogenes]HEQ9152402.1 type 2 lantipeptide synthetase LanM family protein [Streptococcus pyogenes]HEQ9647623.1 type 2 lantipeptide synthetase LanM family protein [Streptococcus pyogenes]
MIKRNELKLEYQQHQFYEYFNSIFDYDILDTSISENIYLLREKTHKLFYSEFENQLFETIMFLSMKTLVLDINHFSKEIENKSKAYEQYIQQIREENGISNFFDRYPYLLKQINREVGLVVESYSLLFDRFLKDLSEIRSCFNITESLSNVEFSLGDSHSQKQTVVKIEFKGKSVYYKPKSYDSYNILLELISLLKSNNIPSFSLPESLIKADYCWQLGVAYTSSNKDEVAKIYFKYGVLAAFSEIFSITDLHMENVIVSGGDLYLIDVETFFQRKLNVQNQNFEGITVDTYQRIYKTSLSNGLFPVQFEKNSAPNVSGISGKGGKRKKGKYELINKNRGDMKLVKTDYFQEDGYNILTLNGKVVEPLDYANEVIAGFRECYTFLMSQRAKVKKILEDFPKLKTRAIFRNTSDYGKFLQASTNPKYLFSEKKRENLFSILHESKHIEQFIVVSEIKDLMNGDIPYFSMDTSGNVYFSLWKRLKLPQYQKLYLDIIKEFSSQSLEEQNIDYISGVSGLLVVLCNIYNVEQNKTVYHLINRISEFIIDNVKKEDDKVYWVSDFSDSEILNGLSHGQSGIAYALLLSWKINKNYNYFKIAKSAIDFENTRISDGNWIDFRNKGKRSELGMPEPIYWCHGATGIGLTRYRESKWLNDKELKNNYEMAKQTVLNNGYLNSDCLCHGKMGNMELFMNLDDSLKNEVDIEGIILNIVRNSQKFGWESGLPQHTRVFNMMVGEIGIAYQLLRYISNYEVPSLLLLDVPKGSIENEKDYTD